MKSLIRMLKVKIKSLADESRIIRLEERKSGRDEKLRCLLREHRVKDVRKEARASLLAYAYIKGKPFQSVEKLPKCRIAEPDWERVRSLVEKFGGLPGFKKGCSREEILAWRSAELSSQTT